MLDTNIVVAGLLWSGKPRRLVDLAFEGKVILLSSPEMMAEFATVLTRSKFDRQIAATGGTISALVRGYLQLVQLVDPVRLKSIAPDPDDDWVIATAIAANADLIVTGDKPFLSVGGQLTQRRCNRI